MEESKDKFMGFFRKEETNRQLNDFDREELFKNAFTSPSDITPELLVELFQNMEADPIVLLEAYKQLNSKP